MPINIIDCKTEFPDLTQNLLIAYLRILRIDIRSAKTSTWLNDHDLFDYLNYFFNPDLKIGAMNISNYTVIKIAGDESYFYFFNLPITKIKALLFKIKNCSALL